MLFPKTKGLPLVDPAVEGRGASEAEENGFAASFPKENGEDMVAAYLRANFDPQLAGIVCAVADVGDRAREYSEETKAAVKAMSS